MYDNEHTMDIDVRCTECATPEPGRRWTLGCRRCEQPTGFACAPCASLPRPLCEACAPERRYAGKQEGT